MATATTTTTMTKTVMGFSLSTPLQLTNAVHELLSTMTPLLAL